MARFKINLKTPFLDGEGNPIKNGDEVINLSKMLANHLFNASSKEPVKLFEWGLELIKSGILTVDTTDKEMMVKFIKDSDSMTVIAKGRLLNVITEAKELKEA